MELTGERGLFLFSAFIHAAMAVFSIWVMRRRAPAAEEEKTTFKEAVLAAQTVAPLEMGAEGMEDGTDTSDKT
jgi:hypothetical protein